MTDLEKRLAAKKRLVPREGYNLVVVDPFERELDSELTLVAHYEKRGEAQREQKRLAALHPQLHYYVYDKDS